MDRNVQLLSARERQILELLAEGHTDATISSQMHIPATTVRKYIENMLRKQGFVSSYQLINWAYREAVIS